MKPVPMKPATVALLLAEASAEIAELGSAAQALVKAPARFCAVTLIDGPRRLRIASSGVSDALPYLGSACLVDAVLEFAEDGDPLWAFDHLRNGLPVAGDDRKRAALLERAVRRSLVEDPVRACRALRVLAGLHGLSVPEGVRQGRPEASTT